MSTITIKANYHSLLQLINGAEAHECRAVFTLLKCCCKTTYVINILCGKVYPFFVTKNTHDNDNFPWLPWMM